MARNPAQSDSSDSQPSVSEALARNGTTGETWYAVLDAARDASFLERSGGSSQNIESLYAGEKGAQYEDVAPHLCVLEPNGPLWENVTATWGASRGILFQSGIGFAAIRKHLRQFLLVSDPSGAKFRFRFYDPRVLRSFLPVCNKAETRAFFGPISRFFFEGRYGRSLHVFDSGPQGAQQQTIPVRREKTSAREETAQSAADEMGMLIVALNDADSGEQLMHASVYLAGPESYAALSERGGIARFERVAAGRYNVTAMTQDHRMGSRKVNIEGGKTRIEILCKAVGA